MKKIGVVLLAILLSTTCAVIISLFFKDKNIVVGQQHEEEFLQRILNEIVLLENKYSDSYLKEQYVSFGSDSIGKSLLSDIVDNKLFFFFSNSACYPCITKCVEIISEYYPDYKSNDEIVFVSVDYPARLKDDCYGKKVMNLELGELGIDLEGYDVPFLFSLTKDLRIKDINIVFKSDYNRTDTFVKSFKEAK